MEAERQNDEPDVKKTPLLAILRVKTIRNGLLHATKKSEVTGCPVPGPGLPGINEKLLQQIRLILAGESVNFQTERSDNYCGREIFQSAKNAQFRENHDFDIYLHIICLILHNYALKPGNLWLSNGQEQLVHVFFISNSIFPA